MVSAAMAQTDFRHISYAEGLEAAKAEGKTLFIDFYTEWCGPCKRMARDVFPQKDVCVPAEGRGGLHEREVRVPED